MTMREDLLDAVIAGDLPYRVTRQAVMNHFKGGKYADAYLGVALSNAELDAGHSPTWEKYTIRVDAGTYLIHPDSLKERLANNGVI